MIAEGLLWTRGVINIKEDEASSLILITFKAGLGRERSSKDSVPYLEGGLRDEDEPEEGDEEEAAEEDEEGGDL